MQHASGGHAGRRPPVRVGLESTINAAGSGGAERKGKGLAQVSLGCSGKA